MIEKFIFLAQVLCGAEFALADIRKKELADPHSEGRAKRAKIVIEIMHKVFEEQNYHVKIRKYNQELGQYQLYSSEDIYALGETYLDETNPGSVVFIYNNNLESEMTFEITGKIPKEIAGRFDQQSYDVLVSEVRTVLRFIE